MSWTGKDEGTSLLGLWPANWLSGIPSNRPIGRANTDEVFKDSALP